MTDLEKCLLALCKRWAILVCKEFKLPKIRSFSTVKKWDNKYDKVYGYCTDAGDIRIVIKEGNKYHTLTHLMKYVCHELVHLQDFKLKHGKVFDKRMNSMYKYIKKAVT